MNIESEKYHPGGPSCNYKGGKVSCLVEFSEGGYISGHIITNVLRNLDALKLYENYGKKLFFLYCWLMEMVVILKFLQYICDKNHKWVIVFGVPYETSLWQVGDTEK